MKGARDYAREHHLSLKVEEEDSDGENDGTVLRQSPESGTEMNSGDTLTVVVAKAKKNDSTDTSSSSTTTTTVTKSYTINYPGSADQSGSEKA